MQHSPGFVFADGYTYDPDRDHQRLSRQQAAVFAAMARSRTPAGDAGGWCTMHAIHATVEYLLGQSVSEASVSARIRDLRKLRNGLHIIDRRRRSVAGGTWEYRLVPAGSSAWISRWHEYQQQLATSAVTDEQQAADELSAWLTRWRHVVTETDSARIGSMAGAILRGRDRHQPMPGQTTIPGCRP